MFDHGMVHNRPSYCLEAITYRLVERRTGRLQREAGGNEAAPDSSPLAGKTVVVIGAGGAGRALAFGAADKGAQVSVAPAVPRA